MQFVIFLSALLASLTGLVSGERQPVRAQMEMSTAGAASLAEKAVATARPDAGSALSARPATRPMLAMPRAAMPARAAPTHTRLALKQSWLF